MDATQRQAAIDAFAKWLDANAVFDSDGVKHRKQDEFHAWIAQDVRGLVLRVSHPEHIAEMLLGTRILGNRSDVNSMLDMLT